MDVKNLLPIGSVVQLKAAKKLLMIIGIKVMQDKNIVYDYISVMYPEGYVNRDIYFKFNHEDIEEVKFEGYYSEEMIRFQENVQKVEKFSEEIFIKKIVPQCLIFYVSATLGKRVGMRTAKGSFNYNFIFITRYCCIFPWLLAINSL